MSMTSTAGYVDSKPWLDLYQTDFATLRAAREKEIHLLCQNSSTSSSLPCVPEVSNTEGTEENGDSEINLTALPAEVLSAICSLLEAEHLSTLAEVNSTLISHAYDPKHWRRIARETWPLESERELSKHLYAYKTWRLLCTQRPRLRTNALFVLRHQFAKTSSRASATEPQAPVFLVTYYRFLRFYNSGVVVSLTTPEAPHISYTRVKDVRDKYMNIDRDESRPLVGYYTFHEEKQEVHLEVPMKHAKFPNMKGGKIYMELSLRTTTPGAFNRLYLKSHFAIMDAANDFDDDGCISYPCDAFVNKPFRLIPILKFQDMIEKEFSREDDNDLAQWYEMKNRDRSGRGY